MKIVIIDNYDSFTYNLVHLVEGITGKPVDVLFNDKFELDIIASYDKIILSPGPGLPQNAGKTLQLIHKYQSAKSILGVCLGHQAIGVAFGCSLKNLQDVYHGIETEIFVLDNEKESAKSLFNNIPEPLIVGRYHSWVIDKHTLKEDLIISAIDSNNEIMAIKHKHFDIAGVQFHPESIMTNYGKEIMRNWLET